MCQTAGPIHQSEIALRHHRPMESQESWQHEVGTENEDKHIDHVLYHVVLTRDANSKTVNSSGYRSVFLFGVSVLVVS